MTRFKVHFYAHTDQGRACVTARLTARPSLPSAVVWADMFSLPYNPPPFLQGLGVMMPIVILWHRIRGDPDAPQGDGIEFGNNNEYKV